MLNKLRKLQNKKGFTLVELIVVIAIIAILTAVIVPLVSRYTTQATYTSLQAGADSIQSQANAAIAAYSMTGKVFPYLVLTGEGSATDGTPTNMNVQKVVGTNISLGFTGEGISLVPLTADEAKDASLDKVKESLEQGLKQKLAKSSSFVVTIYNGGVTGVLYNPNGTTLPADTNSLTAIEGYDDAYKCENDACGMLGVFKSAAIDSKTYKDAISSGTTKTTEEKK